MGLAVIIYSPSGRFCYVVWNIEQNQVITLSKKSPLAGHKLAHNVNTAKVAMLKAFTQNSLFKPPTS